MQKFIKFYEKFVLEKNIFYNAENIPRWLSIIKSLTQFGHLITFSSFHYFITFIKQVIHHYDSFLNLLVRVLHI